MSATMAYLIEGPEHGTRKILQAPLEELRVAMVKDPDRAWTPCAICNGTGMDYIGRVCRVCSSAATEYRVGIYKRCNRLVYHTDTHVVDTHARASAYIYEWFGWEN